MTHSQALPGTKNAKADQPTMQNGDPNTPEDEDEAYLDYLYYNDDDDKYYEIVSARRKAAEIEDDEALKHEVWSCKIGDLLEVAARLDLTAGWDDPTPVILLPQGQVYRAEDLKGRGWDLVLVSGEGPPELRIMNGEIPQFFKVLPP